MKLKPIAPLITVFLICCAPSVIALAQSSTGQEPAQKPEQKRDDKVTVPIERKFSVKLFEIKHRSPSSLRNALYVLGSGSGGSEMVANDQLRTLTIRDFPENIGAVEEALKRLDVPEQSPISLEFRLHLISASMTPSEKSQFPKNLEPVLTQLRSTLRFTNYRYISSAMNRVSDGGQLESSGVTGSLFPLPSNITNTAEIPTLYQYKVQSLKLKQDATGKETLQIDNFRFGVSVPIKISGSGTQYRDIGINTPLTLREGEMAVVGTANISGSDEAIIVVVSVHKVK
jgi:hypothetical protein